MQRSMALIRNGGPCVGAVSFLFFICYHSYPAVALFIPSSYLLCILTIHKVFYIHQISGNLFCSLYFALKPVLPSTAGGFPSVRSN